MTATASHGLPLRFPARRIGPRVQARRDRVFRTWRASIWTAAAVGTAALATTALNAIPGTPADEIVMATAYTLTGILGHLAPLPE
jgi:hypothetical protein